MKYLLTFAPETPSPFTQLSADALAAGKAKLAAAMQDGSVDVAYHKIGGGGFMVVNSSSHDALAKILRGYNLTDVEVTPLLDTQDVLTGYQQARAKLEA
jgi:hypothetical protein